MGPVLRPTNMVFRAVVIASVFAVQSVVARAQTKSGAETAAVKQPPSASAMARVRGFNIVLLLGDLQNAAPDTSSNVPPAAKKALADMSAFLPYKTYRLLDSSWILTATDAMTATSRLRGLEEREYELAISATSEPAGAPAGRSLRVTFQLTDGAARQASATPSLDYLHGQMNEDRIRREFQKLIRDYESRLRPGGIKEGERGAREADSARAETLRRLGQAGAAKEGERGANDVDSQKLRVEMQRLLNQIGNLENRHRAQSSGVPASGRAEVVPVVSDRSSGRILNTGFIMDIGETVVVGTSRIGGDKAIIALLTAVPREVPKR